MGGPSASARCVCYRRGRTERPAKSPSARSPPGALTTSQAFGYPAAGPTLDGVPWYEWIFIAVAVTALVWAAGVALLVISGRRTEARAMARFMPDCLVLVRRLLTDSRIPRRRKLVLVALLAYLAMPIDLRHGPDVTGDKFVKVT